MIQKLLEIIHTANANYEATFEESKMANIAVDSVERTRGFAYIEEYRQGSYSIQGYMPTKTTTLQIYFMRFCDMHNTALERETLRTQIETEIVKPFMNAYNTAGLFAEVTTWKFYTPVPRFDANEVTIMLQFDCKQPNQCV